MSVNRNPHSSWAEVYDLAYGRSFGESYDSFTVATIKVITDRLHRGGSIVDFGAGTGRLSIPLADKKFEVAAVDPCREMLCQLEKKRREGMKLRTVCSKMQDFKENNFDFALCVFTVLLYMLDEETLKKALSAAHGALNSGGMLLIDIPSRMIFQSYSRKDDLLERFVSVTEKNKDIYHYQEKLKVREPSGNESTYLDEFKIRYWPSEYVSDILATIGFTLEADLTDHFSGTGSHYWIMKKAEQDAAPDGNSAALNCHR
ncbi:class I SAM-dependent methyltransferase [bacterium]|nr:class I SAM-dependent methyltransferase [bacterium]